MVALNRAASGRAAGLKTIRVMGSKLIFQSVDVRCLSDYRSRSVRTETIIMKICT
jgi:hypothetical protein